MKVLMVLTSHDQLGNTGRKTGFWLEELAAPYYVFKDAGAQITLASPKGGRPPLDPKSNEPNFQTDITRRFEKDTDAGAQLDRTVRLDSVKQDRDRFHQWRGRRGGIDEGGALPRRGRTDEPRCHLFQGQELGRSHSRRRPTDHWPESGLVGPGCQASD